ncbi:Gluconate 2-dehydrogenase subunit 3 [Cyclobacterium xiamenense]|uniref:Gluconate 2-dehydrogenase subunit 3 n=2 Tax=Cyclobacterium xiamenense TaxID=1297121 RepID=A0A1H7A119_9BACT|nr:Gluconate 2-dehydrogenase subunit 3 [Cyclobacterium xiamenense]
MQRNKSKTETYNPLAMDRRLALKQTALLVGGTVVGAELFLSGCGSETPHSFAFTSRDISLMDEIGETILPESDQSPGAKAAEIGHFMAKMVLDCYGTGEQEIFRQGLKTIDRLAKEDQGVDFLSLDFQQKTELLTRLDWEATQSTRGESVHFYTLIKQLTLLGYFTSEIGVSQALRYNPSPGEYDGCVPYNKGTPAWFGPTSSIG